MIKSLGNAYTSRPGDVKDGDAFAAKIVAAAGYADDWALYIGPSDWTDEQVRDSGNKLGEGEVPFSYLMQLRQYRR